MFLDDLLLKNDGFDVDLLSDNLFISFDKNSALRKDYNSILKLVKIYSKYAILNEKTTTLQENYIEKLYLVSADEEKLFIRLILENDLYNDIMIYHLENNEVFNNFFKKEEQNIPEAFLNNYEKENGIILNFPGKHLKIVKASSKFYKKFKYEDWDYENKFQNILDEHIVSLVINDDDVNLVLVNSYGEKVKFHFRQQKKGSIYYWYEG